MKTVTIILSYLFLLSSQLLAENEFFNNLGLTRISSNFSGSASNGDAIVVYGDGGIIMRSTNNGNNWQKIILPDYLKIIGMTNIGTKFFGLCSQKYGITSDDNGLTWNYIDYGSNSQFYQLIRANNKNYALLNYKVWILDDNFNKIKEYSFTSDTAYFNFTVCGNQLIISSGNGKLTFINTDNDQKQTRPLSDFGGCTNCPLVSNLKSNGANLIFFILKDKLMKFDLATNSLFKVCNVIKSQGADYYVINSNLFYLYSRKISSQLDSLYFHQIDIITGNFSRINISTMDYYINGLYFQAIQQLNSNTLIAVGNNNLIYMSYDSGNHWMLKSYLGNIFQIYQFDNLKYRAIGPSGQFFKSDDAGATWLPPSDYYKEFYENYGFNNPLNSYGAFSFKDIDNGFLTISAQYVGDKSCIYTQNGGKNLGIKYVHDFYTGINSYTRTDNKKYILYQWGDLGKYIGKWTIMLQLNDTLGIEKKTTMGGMQMFYADKDNNGFYGIGKDTTLPSNIYTVLNSTDGLTWNKDFTFQIEVPLMVNSDNNLLVDDYIFSSWAVQRKEQNDSFMVQLIYRIDLKNKTSKKILDLKADGLWKMIKIKDDYYVAYYSYDPNFGRPILKMISTNNIESENVIWTDTEFKRFGVPNIVSSLNDSNLIFTTYDTLFKTNAIYLGKIDKPTDVYDNTENKHLCYIIISPNPAQDYIDINVPRWRGIKGVDLRIFDILGMELTTPSLRDTPPYQGGEIIRLDISTFAPGVYFVRVGDVVRKFVKM